MQSQPILGDYRKTLFLLKQRCGDSQTLMLSQEPKHSWF